MSELTPETEKMLRELTRFALDGSVVHDFNAVWILVDSLRAQLAEAKKELERQTFFAAKASEDAVIAERRMEKSEAANRRLREALESLHEMVTSAQKLNSTAIMQFIHEALNADATEGHAALHGETDELRQWLIDEIWWLKYTRIDNAAAQGRALILERALADATGEKE